MAGAARYEIEHVSRYRYASPVRRCAMLLCLEPSGDRGQRLLRFAVETRPTGGMSRETDSFGNVRHVLDVHEAHRTLEITARSAVESPPGTELPQRLGASAWQEIHALGGSFADWDFIHPEPPDPVHRRSRRIRRSASHQARRRPAREPSAALGYAPSPHAVRAPGATSAESSVDHILRTDRGVCQDFAHAMIAVARSWGVPARYVSGYLHVTARAGVHVPDNATHAWVECRLPGLGWIGFDPTNRSLAGAGHVRIATGRDYRDVSPTRGVVHGGGAARLEVDVRVRTGSGPDGAAPACRGG